MIERIGRKKEEVYIKEFCVYGLLCVGEWRRLVGNWYIVCMGLFPSCQLSNLNGPLFIFNAPHFHFLTHIPSSLSLHHPIILYPSFILFFHFFFFFFLYVNQHFHWLSSSLCDLAIFFYKFLNRLIFLNIILDISFLFFIKRIIWWRNWDCAFWTLLATDSISQITSPCIDNPHRPTPS